MNFYPIISTRFEMNKSKAFQLFLLLIIVLTMYNNLEHSAKVYYQISANSSYSDWYNHLQSFLVVIVIDLSIIAFIISTRHKESIVFAWVLFMVNCIFFDVAGSMYDILNGKSHVELITSFNRLLSKLIYSAIFSYSIHRFSYLWYESTQAEDLKERVTYLETELELACKELCNVDQELNLTKKALESEEKKIKSVSQELSDTINNLNISNDKLYLAEMELVKEKLKHAKGEKAKAELNQKLNQ